VTAQVQGAAALGLAWPRAAATFTGTVSGNSLDLSNQRNPYPVPVTIAFTRNAPLVGTVAGDGAHRQRDLQLRHQQDADCGIRDTCRTYRSSTHQTPTVKL